MKKELLKLVANVVEDIAIRASSSTSLVGYHQPVEPESVRKAAEERRQAKLAKKIAKKK